MSNPDQTATTEFEALMQAELGGDTDTIMEALADRQRREVLSYVVQAGETRSLYDIASHLTAIGRARTSLKDTPERNATRLHHIHLPKLTEAGLVEYDHDEKRVEATEDGVKVQSSLPP